MEVGRAIRERDQQAQGHEGRQVPGFPEGQQGVQCGWRGEREGGQQEVRAEKEQDYVACT